MRLNKFISQSGYCSRRRADQLIIEGAVLVNGVSIRALGSTVDPIKDVVKVEGNKIRSILSKSYIAFYKPMGLVSTMAEGDGTLAKVAAEMNVPGLFHVGRLDQESEGLILLTNDGEWANRVSHPRYEMRKIYEVTLDREIGDNHCEQLLQGVLLDDGLFKADSARRMGRGKVALEIHDGRNRIIRRVFAELNYEVLQLKRVAIGGISLGRMRPGDWKEIDPLRV
jgi:23S rRNA pseudouridine2605 synthase